MPPRRAKRHQDIEEVYRREEGQQMEQRLSGKLDEGIDRLEKLMNDLNRSQRRTSPVPNQA